MKKKTTIELLFLASVAVIVLAGFVIISHDKMKPTQTVSRVEGAAVSAESPKEMMKILDNMGTSSDAGDLNQLKADTSKL